MRKTKLMITGVGRGVAVAAGIAGLVAGLSAPALALTRTDRNNDWSHGSESARWTDSSPGYADSRITTSEGCSREFSMTIREDRSWQPDPDRGSEWIDCSSYADAVYATGSTNFDKKHHYDVKGLRTYNYGLEGYVYHFTDFVAVVRW